MRRLVRGGIIAATVLAVGAGTAYAVDTALHAGPQGNGTSVTPAGWRVTPAGEQTPLGSLPTASALSPDGKLLLVLNAGDATNESVQAGTVYGIAAQVEGLCRRFEDELGECTVVATGGLAQLVRGGGLQPGRHPRLRQLRRCEHDP